MPHLDPQIPASSGARQFCADCGAALAHACRACGFTNQGGDRFCGGCAAQLPANQHAPEGGLDGSCRCIAKRDTDRILRSRRALEGERKLVTVLFADVKGSMELLANRDPEEARGLLDPALEIMMQAVHRYDGTVNQIMGDGIMSLFGAPFALEDHALRACHAALWMQQAMGRYSESVMRSFGVSIQIRVGLDSGLVVVRSIENDLHMDYTAVGRTTHVAARMEQIAKPGSVLLANDMFRLVEGRVRTKPLGPMPVKGLGDPVEVYELVGARPDQRPAGAAARPSSSMLRSSTLPVPAMATAVP
jgi:class 3 adenylate cyclase